MTDNTTPPADDVREAVARAIFHPHAPDAHRESWLRDAAAYPESALASTHRREMKTVDRFLAEFEVRPRGTVTDAEVEAALLAYQQRMTGSIREQMRAALEAAREAQR